MRGNYDLSKALSQRCNVSIGTMILEFELGLDLMNGILNRP